MNLKELIKDVERLKELKKYECTCSICYDKDNKLEGIKQTVEVMLPYIEVDENHELDNNWQKLKKLLGLK